MIIDKPHDFTKVIVEVMEKLGCEDIWWRGQSDSTWELAPSVYRKNRNYLYERNVCARFMWRAPARYPNCPADTDNAGWLMLMQHYRLPTRLLDWAESPLVALFFAVSEHYSAPGALWALNPYKLNKGQIGQEAAQNPRSQCVEPIFRAAFTPLQEDTSRIAGKIVAVYTPHVDLRVLVQQSTFTIHDTRTPLSRLEDSGEFLLKIEIPPEQKQAFRIYLWMLGIRKSTLFPDLEHLAEELEDMTFEPHDVTLAEKFEL